MRRFDAVRHDRQRLGLPCPFERQDDGLPRQHGEELPEGAIEVGAVQLVDDQPSSGLDGADLALLDEVAEIELLRRFDRVCIGSGDGIFAAAAAKIAAAGVEVTVVTRPRALSGRLRLATMDVRYLPVPLAHEPRVA